MISRRQVVRLSLADGSGGTGFLVTPDKLVTALHVVAEHEGDSFVLDGKRPRSVGLVTCTYVVDGREPWSSEPINFDPDADPHSIDDDWVVLTVAHAPAGAVMSCAALTDDWRGHECWTFGFPPVAADDGTPAWGRILACAEPRFGTSRGHFHSACFEQLRSATGFDPRGFSGGPITVAGKVVGLVREVLDAGRRLPLIPDEPRVVLAEGGLVYAVPIETVLAEAELPLARELGPPGSEQSRSDEVVFEGPGASVAKPMPFFSGRYEELNELEQLLDSSAATVCVVATGIGGIGKTALVREFVATRAPERFPDGAVWLDATRLISELARACVRFGWGRASTPSPDEAIAFLHRVLGERRVLIVVDDLAPELGRGEPEHVPRPGGECRTIVTSRMRSLDVALDAELIELGVWTAAACRGYLYSRCRGRQHAEDELDALADFVGRLPLALRLLASLIRRRAGTTLTELLESLNAQPLGMLERHAHSRGIVATFQLSYASLEGASKRVLGVLAVCASNTRVAVVAAVADVDDALVRLDDLYDRGFAELWRGVDGETRWGLHEVVRMFVLAQPGLDELEAAHDRWVDAHIRRHPEPTKQRGFSAGVDEVHTAYKRLLRRDVERAYSLYLPLVSHLRVVGRYAEALELSERMFEAAPANSPSAATALTYQGELHRTMGAPTRALALHERALAVSVKLGDVISQAVSLGNLGACHQALGNVDRALELHSQALVMHERHGPLEGQANRISSIGLCFASLGELGEAIRNHELARSIYAILDQREGQAKQLTNLGDCYRIVGEFEQAIACQQAALAIHEDLGNVQGSATALGNLGACHQSRGEFERAKQLFERALSMFEELGDIDGLAISYVNLATCHRTVGDRAEAIMCYERSLALFEQTENLEGQATAHGNLGIVVFHGHESEGARRHLERAIELLRRMGVAPDHSALRQFERVMAAVLHQGD